MKHYLIKEKCRIEKRHYSILLHFIQKWEENFWDDDKVEQKLLSDSAKFYAGILLFKTYNEIVANTLDRLYTQELIQINPMLRWNTALATQQIKEMAENSLLEKLEQNPQLLFDVSPLLSEKLELCTKQFGDALSEMLIRIQENRQQIRDTFFDGNDFGKIIKFDSSGADQHQNGRFTCIIITEHGKFLYKPRKMQADIVLYDLVSDLFSDTLILPKALDFGSYGYAEFIVDEPATTKEAAERFFYRLGGASAIFQVFGSNDFHCENILANGEFPAVVDLETFLGIPVSTNMENTDLFQRDLQFSLFFSGILPKRSDERELSPLLCKDQNSILPLIDGKREDVRGYISYFDAGFRAIYRRCIEKKSSLLTYLERFSNCSFRCLLKNTNDYARLLRDLYSVKSLSSKDYFNQRIEMIREKLGRLGQEIADEELAALICGDIPIFHCIAKSKNLYSGEKCVVQDYFSSSIIENVRYRIEHMTDAECEFELGIIHQSLRCAHIVKDDLSVKQTAPREEALSFREEAADVFDKIWEQRLVSPSGKAGWLDHKYDGNSFGYLSVEYGMGEGGIAAFASEYYMASGDARAEKVIIDFLDKISKRVPKFQLTESISTLTNMLGITSIGGTIKAVMMAARAIDSKKYIQCAVDMVRQLSSAKIENITRTDFYSGISGWLYLMCTNEEVKVIPNYKEYITSLSDRILEFQTLMTPQGILTWDTLNKNRPISGLGHGIAGIGLALASAYRLYPSDKLWDAVQAAFELEHMLYSDKLKTWPDYRQYSVPTVAMNGYCSGAPGIGSVYRKLHEWGITDFDADMEKAINKVVSTEVLSRDHYCCGNSASIEFLLDAGKELARPKLTQDALQRLTTVVKRKAANGEYTFLPERYENYSPLGVLNGLSGIGHVLLKADDVSLNGLFI